MKILSKIDNFLNSITMYRLMLYGLSILALFAIIFSSFNLIHYSPVSLLLSLIILLSTCYFTNLLISKIVKAPVNLESSFISALILFFIIAPAKDLNDVKILFIVGALAIISKYVLAYKAKHIFNPVAIGTVVIGLFGSGNVYWWVANKPLFPFVLIFSLLVVRKIRRFSLFFSFLIVSMTIMVFNAYSRIGGNIFELIWQNIISWPTIFFAGIMLTEPLTTPPTKKLKIAYGILVGILFSIHFQFGPVFSNPETALVIGNIFAFIFSLKRRIFLTLKEKREIAKDIYEFSFEPNAPLSFKAGQYLEWTNEHKKIDSRGERRYFTIASSPTEKEIKIGIKITPEKSSFKNNLASFNIGDKIVAGSLDGDFVLPQNKMQKLVFIAGGIGVTPFRSMIKYILDMKEEREIVLFYSIKAPEEIAYKDLFEEAEKNRNVKIVYVVSNNEIAGWQGEVGFITKDMISKYVPKYNEFNFYLSGPNAMVESYKKIIKGMGVNGTKIYSDYFPGF